MFDRVRTNIAVNVQAEIQPAGCLRSFARTGDAAYARGPARACSGLKQWWQWRSAPAYGRAPRDWASALSANLLTAAGYPQETECGYEECSASLYPGKGFLALSYLQCGTIQQSAQTARFKLREISASWHPDATILDLKLLCQAPPDESRKMGVPFISVSAQADQR